MDKFYKYDPLKGTNKGAPQVNIQGLSFLQAEWMIWIVELLTLAHKVPETVWELLETWNALDNTAHVEEEILNHEEAGFKIWNIH